MSSPSLDSPELEEEPPPQAVRESARVAAKKPVKRFHIVFMVIFSFYHWEGTAGSYRFKKSTAPWASSAVPSYKNRIVRDKTGVVAG